MRPQRNTLFSHTSASLEHVLQARVRGRKRQVHHERRQTLDPPAGGGLHSFSLFILSAPPSLLSGRLSDCGGLFAARLVGRSGARSLVADLLRVFTFGSWLGQWRTRSAALVGGGSAPVASVARLLLLLLLLGFGLLLALRWLRSSGTREDRTCICRQRQRISILQSVDHAVL